MPFRPAFGWLRGTTTRRQWVAISARTRLVLTSVQPMPSALRREPGSLSRRAALGAKAVWWHVRLGRCRRTGLRGGLSNPRVALR
ncbi:hypothetical protein L1887_52678 [Cichorium endivia]|nr:hypothetical protein L1887_52678 [Cichorium endivia]